MRNRIPTYPNRVKLTPVSGLTNVYTMVRADEPTDEGTPLNKATLLSDDTAVRLRFADSDDPTVNDALNFLGDASIVFKRAGEPTGAIPAEVGDIYVNTAASPQTVWVCVAVSDAGATSWHRLVVLQRVYKTEIFTAGTTWTVPNNIDSDVSILLFGGGGGGGKRGYYSSSRKLGAAGGGGGGHMARYTGTLSAGTQYVITIGAGGAEGTAGGVTSFGSLVSASGGSAGTGNEYSRPGGDGGSGGGGGAHEDGDTHTTSASNGGAGSYAGGGGGSVGESDGAAGGNGGTYGGAGGGGYGKTGTGGAGGSGKSGAYAGYTSGAQTGGGGGGYSSAAGVRRDADGDRVHQVRRGRHEKEDGAVGQTLHRHGKTPVEGRRSHENLSQGGTAMIYSGKYKVTSPFGRRTLNGAADDHKGIDVVGLGDKYVCAVVSGTVASTIITDKSDRTWEWGNYVRVDGDDGQRYYYCHLSKRLVSAGRRVEAGEHIGIEGNTGYSFGSHCHFEVRERAGNSINPAPFLGIPNVCGTYGTDWRAEVQKKFGLSAGTMAYLDKYRYAADLYRKLGQA